LKNENFKKEIYTPQADDSNECELDCNNMLPLAPELSAAHISSN
jgi:hypothetical protein